MLRSNQPDSKSLIIREVSPGDIAVLDRLFPKRVPNKHKERLDTQLQRSAVYLIASVHDKPVGHVLLLWDGEKNPAVAERYKNYPVIEDLHIERVYKGRGIEEKILDECYKRLKEKGSSALGTSVGVEQATEKVFFITNGFIDSGIPEYQTEIPYLDDVTGEQKMEIKICRFLIKHL